MSPIAKYVAKCVVVYVAGYVVSCILFVIHRRIEIKRVHVPSVTVPVIVFVSLGSWLTALLMALGLLYTHYDKQAF